ncbi:MAG: type II toxin-antitoxin system RelE/ParE family toxin [Oligoflexia bacterium]|nr:type II toxin-antitoxin system RelE/ParE family toxin [Oligoflexia bacterium]
MNTLLRYTLLGYYNISTAIQSFADTEIEKFSVAGKAASKVGWSPIQSVAKRKLDMIHYSAQLVDLRFRLGNRLEELKGNLTGLHSIRINDQWRVVFRWTAAGPAEVRIEDYH